MAKLDFDDLDLVKEIEDEVYRLKAAIDTNISRAGLRASGRTQKSMRVVTRVEPMSVRVTLTGRPFFAALETGSTNWTGKTGIKCTIAQFTTIIREWIRNKGLHFDNPDKAARSIAWVIATQGTKTRRERAFRNDIYTQPIEETREQVRNRVTLFWRTQINKTLIKVKEEAINED